MARGLQTERIEDMLRNIFLASVVREPERIGKSHCSRSPFGPAPGCAACRLSKTACGRSSTRRNFCSTTEALCRISTGVHLSDSAP